MTRKQQIEAAVEKAMSSIDNLIPASPSPFFYTRLTGRLIREEKNVWGRLSRIVSRPVVATFSVALIIGINIFAVLHHHSVTQRYSYQIPEQVELAVADEYNYASLYNIDNVQP